MHELYTEGMLVQVALETDDVCLDAALGAVVYRRAMTDVQHSGVTLAFGVGINGIDPFFRNQFVCARGLEIRRGES